MLILYHLNIIVVTNNIRQDLVVYYFLNLSNIVSWIHDNIQIYYKSAIQ
jgi:hypothetical protein